MVTKRERSATAVSADSGKLEQRRLIDFHDSDLVIGLVAPAGSDLEYVSKSLSDQLRNAGYAPTEIRVSKDIIARATGLSRDGLREAQAIQAFRDAGDQIRSNAGDNAILADGIAREIRERRDTKRQAYVVNSLKHPEEVRRLRRIYGGGFYLLAVSPDDPIRKSFLKRKGVADDEFLRLIARDHDDETSYGQKVSDTFHLADFFVRWDGNEPHLQGELARVCRILFGDPFATPSFDEFAMFLAFASALRSADTSRQVGAVIARNKDIVSTGANDCPRPGGGLYWPEWSSDVNRVSDKIGTRDYVAGGDPNRGQKRAIIEEILGAGQERGLDRSVLEQVLVASRLGDITEYQRAVHAEMEALLSAARNGVSTRGATLYCTTFPCHNCAKHIVAAGVNRVVFIEPYRKSKAQELHKDAIVVGPAETNAPHDAESLVRFEPFVGVGPRRFFDFFSTRLGTGREIDRRAHTSSWELITTSTLRVQMKPASHIEMETEAKDRFESLVPARKLTA